MNLGGIVDEIMLKLWPAVCVTSKRATGGNSLVVQWLGLNAFTAVGPGPIPGHPESRKVVAKKKNLLERNN